MNKIFLVILLLSSNSFLFGQTWSKEKRCIIDQATGECVTNTLLTALPFMHINPDARAGGIGDAGLATSADPNALHFNASKLAFVENKFALSATLSPWLRNLNIDDIYLLYLSGYYKVGKDQAVGGAIRYFSLGAIDFRDEFGNDLGTGRPNEIEITAAYARKLTPKLSASLSAKFALSSLATGRTVSGTQIFPARTFAADVGVFYKGPAGSSGRRNYLSLGAAITNLGAKVTYTKSTTRDFIPTNLGIGANYEMNFDDYNSLNLILDFNKLMVPSTIPQGHPDFDANNNKVADIREKPLFSGVFGSFTDAVGGFTEEMQEITIHPALEYWYDKQFAVRMGYFYEHALKGNRKFFSLGCGVKYNVFSINISYLVPTNINRSPLANTLRFTFIFDLGATSTTEN